MKPRRRDFEYERGYDDYPRRFAPPAGAYFWIYFQGWKQAQRNTES